MFNIQENNIRGLRMERSTGDVFFDIIDNNARDKAKNIAETV